MAELSAVRTSQGERRTIAVESEDPARVIAAVRELGLDSRRNVNMASGLKAIAGFGSQRYAVIDVGTNSVKFHVGERAADGEWRTIVDRADVTRLGEGLDEAGRLEPPAMERTIEAIAAMVDEAERDDAAAIAAVGTAGLRLASNSASFLDAVRAARRPRARGHLGRGRGPSRLPRRDVQGSASAAGALVVFDTGGGSSQFTFGTGQRVDERFSLNVGAVRFAERSGTRRHRRRRGARRGAGRDRGRPVPARRPAGARHLDRDGRHDHESRGGQARARGLRPRRRSGNRARSSGGRPSDRALPQPHRRRAPADRRSAAGRAEVILAGACIVRTVLDKLGCDSLTVSDRGLRHGLLVARFGQA